MEKNTTSTTGSSAKDSFKNSPQFNESSGATAGRASERASEAISNVKSKIADQAGPAVEKFQSKFRDVQESAQPYLENAQSYIRQYPLYTILGAAAIGAVFGMLISRPMNSRMAQQ